MEGSGGARTPWRGLRHATGCGGGPRGLSLPPEGQGERCLLIPPVLGDFLFLSRLQNETVCQNSHSTSRGVTSIEM